MLHCQESFATRNNLQRNELGSFVRRIELADWRAVGDSAGFGFCRLNIFLGTLWDPFRFGSRGRAQGPPAVGFRNRSAPDAQQFQAVKSQGATNANK
jgi:hypothetical protein